MFILHFPDGTRVWVNTETTISYPANFSQDTIRIKLSGEAYFEISDQQKKIYQIHSGPFHVQTSAAFLDLNTYANESHQLMTLIKGTAGVQFLSKDSSVNMMANQQAVVAGQKIQIIPTLEAENLTGWKNGRILYQDADIHDVMGGVARWYDARVSYFGDFRNKRFTVNIPRSAEFSVLKSQLEKQGVRILTHRNSVAVFAVKN